MERGDGGGAMAPRGGVVGSGAMLGLDVHRAPQQMQPVVAFQHQQGGFQLQQPAPVAVRQQQQAPPPPPSFSPYSNTSSSSRVVVSAAAVGPGHDDDDMAGNGGGSGGKGGVVVPQPMAAAAACPWTRMKWTDNMVRLLIAVVYSVGDDGEGVATAGGAGGGNKAGRAGSSGHGHGHGHAAAAQQQKKGKWKSVSHAMMEKGFVVSPQQCEDKFNDLNKRYKRVVDLLGRGRACRVVENHAMLDTLDDLTPKAKDEARKLLSSKHLFFREMCAYHNNMPQHAGGGAAGGDACLHHPLPAPAASSAARHAYAQQQQAAPSPPGMKDSSADVADDDDDDDDDSDDDDVSDDDDSDEDDSDEEDDGPMYPSNNRPSRQHSGGKRGRGEDGAAAEDVDDEAEGGGGRRKRRRKLARVAPDPSAMLRQVKSELASATAVMDPQQARSWMRRRAVEVERQQIRLESHACYLDKLRFKWEQYRGVREHDMERRRLQNDRLRMESRRLLLMLRRKDLELEMAEANSSSVDHLPGASPLPAHQQQPPIGSSPSPSTAGHPN